jgi:hypothetical protein
MKTQNVLFVSLAFLCLAGCSTTHQESVTFERKKGVTIVHHRSRTSHGLVDRIDTLSRSGIVSRAEIHVYDLGRLPHGESGMDEAHRYYRVVQSEHFDLRLPHSTLHPTGPKTALSPPTYSPPPKDQRISDAVAEAKRAKEKLEAAAKQVQDRLQEDNSLRGELQAQIEENQRLQDQINAGFATPQRSSAPRSSTASDAEKAAQAAVDPLVQWGQKVSNGQQQQ